MFRKKDKKKKKGVEEKEPIVYIEPKPDYELVEEYWVIEPYAKVKIMSMPELGGQLAYFVDEVKLNKKESKAKEKLIDILSIELKPPESFEVEVRKYIIEEARRLAKKYRRIVRGLTEESWNRVIYYIERDLIGYGPINVLMEDWNLEDISCDGVNRAIHVWHRKYESIPTNIVFTDKNYLREFIIKLAHLGGKHVSAAFPIVDTMLPGRHRLAATFGEEVSPRGSTFTIRKFREKPFSIVELIDSGNIDTWTAAYLWLMLEHRMTLMIIGGTAAGKSFPGYTKLIVRIDGQTRIVTAEELYDMVKAPEEIVDGHIVKKVSSDIYVLGMDSDYRIKWKKLRKVIKHFDERPLIRLRTNSSITVTTLDHNFVVLDPETLELKAVTAKDLKVGSKIVNCYMPIAFGGGEEISVEKAYLIGLWIADGYISGRDIGFVSKNEELLDRWATLVMEVYGKKVNRTIDRRSGVVLLRFKDNKALDELSRLFIQDKSGTVQVPEEILLNDNEEVLASFLAGYFDGDGSIYLKVDSSGYLRAIVEFSSKSLNLINGLSLILKRLRINHSLSLKSVRDSMYYAIRIQNRRSVARFIELIEKYSTSGKIKPEITEILRKPYEEHEQVDVYPIGPFIGRLRSSAGISKKALDHALGKAERWIAKYEGGARSFSKKTLAELIDFFKRNEDPPEELSKLEKLVEGDLLMEDILSIELVEPINEPLYDLEVESPHLFIIGDIGWRLNHNTTFLNAIASFIKPGMKIVTIEETAELNLPHENWVQLISRESYGLGESKLGEISLYDLVRVSLRYRPDYIIVGEIRGAEAFVLFQAMASVSSDTPILVRKGGEVKLVKIGDFIDSFYPEGVERIPIPVSGVEVLTIDRGKACFKPIRYVLRHRADEIYRIKYVGGKVRATESHSVFVMEPGTLKIRTKAVKDLKKGDLLISFVKKSWAERYPTINIADLLPQHDGILVDNIPKEVKTVVGIRRNPIPLTYLENKISLETLKDAYLKLPRGKTIPMYLRLDEDLAYLLGVYLADGCVKLNNRGGKVVFSLGRGEKDVFDRIVRIFREKFDDTPYIEDRGSYVMVEYSNKLLAHLFKSLCGGRNAEKHVPSKLWTSPQSVIKAFFDGLRADARRSTKRPHQLTIVQKNKRLIQELAWLARLAGFNVRVRREGEYYSITIDYRKSRKPFLGNGVPIDALRRLYANLKPKNMPLKYTYILLNNKRRQKFVRKDIALKVLEWILNNRTREPTEEDRRIIDRIHNLIDGEIVLLPIVDIVREQYEGYVYDVSVPESEAFLGGENPILLHNTGHGGLTTFHADSLENAIRRLMSPPMNISEPYIPMLNMVVYVARTVLPQGGFGRRLMALWEIEDYEKYRQLVKWDPRTDKHTIVGDSYLLGVLADRTGRTRDQLLEEIARRQTVLLWLWQRRIIEMKDVASYIASYYNFPDEVYERALRELEEMGIEVEKYIVRKLVPITRFEPVSTKRTIYDRVMQIYSRYGEKEEKTPLQFISVKQEPVRVAEPLEAVKQPITPKPKEELTSEEEKVLQLISYYGGEIDHKTVMQESGLPRDTFWRTITSLTGKGLVVSSLVYVDGRPMIGFKLTKKGEEYVKS